MNHLFLQGYHFVLECEQIFGDLAVPWVQHERLEEESGSHDPHTHCSKVPNEHL